jgi:ADP-ribose pyrophosphatase
MIGKRTFSGADCQLLSRRTLFQGFFRMAEYRLRHRLFAGGWSRDIRRELFERGHAVGVLPWDPHTDRVALLEQFRVGALTDPDGPWQLEVVAGIVEEGETVEAVARRELEEEAGICDAELLPLCDYLVSPGGTDERMTLFCALANLDGVGGIHGLAGENEDIRVMVVDRAEAMSGLEAGLYNNAPLIIALQWLALHHDKLAGRR